MTWAVQTRNGGAWATQSVVAGTLQSDASRYPRNSLNVSIVPDVAVPLEQTPYGTMVRATLNSAPMFHGSVERSSITRPDGVLELEAWDITARMRFVRKAEEVPSNILGTPSTATVAQAVALVHEHFNVAVPSITGGGFGDVDLSDFDMAGMLGWEAVEEITDSEGCEAFANAVGGLEIRRNPALGDFLSNAPFAVGEKGTMTGYTLTMDRRTNEVLVTVEFPDPASQDERGARVGVWRDASALTGVQNIGRITSTRTVRKGPTWRDKPQADLDAIAEGYARRVRGWARTVEISALPMPVRPGQTITVQFVNGRAEKFLVQAVSLDLTGGPMQVTAVNPNPGSI